MIDENVALPATQENLIEISARLKKLDDLFCGDNASFASAACFQMGCVIAQRVDEINSSTLYRKATVEFLRSLADNLERQFLQ